MTILYNQLASIPKTESIKNEIILLADSLRQKNVKTLKQRFETPNLDEFDKLLDEINPIDNNHNDTTVTTNGNNVDNDNNESNTKDEKTNTLNKTTVEILNEKDIDELVEIFEAGFDEFKDGSNESYDIVLTNWIEIFYPQKRKTKEEKGRKDPYKYRINFKDIIPNMTEEMVKELFIAMVISNKRKEAKEKEEEEKEKEKELEQLNVMSMFSFC